MNTARERPYGMKVIHVWAFVLGAYSWKDRPMRAVGMPPKTRWLPSSGIEPSAKPAASAYRPLMRRMPHDTPLQPDLRSGNEDMPVGEGAEMTFRKPVGRGPWYVVGRRS